ncbi:MAG: type II toxin-antitoxin system HicA family toxin [Candidatus Peribacteraceae bacterium]|nr:type II toxin-antitoxin system HicA family toxin [Candidatus Peribacteraceae bacterium]MBP9850579.1 type II toxin-antitoxin system HicA family toxin [Candidatus Peribacteraceae bacterium]
MRLLHEAGFIDVRQKGSHLILFHPEKRRTVTVPVGKKDLPIGTAKAIVRAGGIEA